MADIVERLNAALVGRYAVERELGIGGMATVYLADDLKHGRRVALKVLKPALTATVGPGRFLAEIRTTANLQHPNILPGSWRSLGVTASILGELPVAAGVPAVTRSRRAARW